MLSAIILDVIGTKLLTSYYLSFLVSLFLLFLELVSLALGVWYCFRSCSSKQVNSEGYFFKRTIWNRFFFLMYILIGITVSAILTICIIVSTR